MNISYNWLKDYLDIEMTPRQVTEALTSIGLETDGLEEVESIKGGLKVPAIPRSSCTRPRGLSGR